MVSSLASDEDNELPKTLKDSSKETLLVITFKLGRQVRGSNEPMKIHNCVQLGSQLLGYQGQAAIYDYLHCYHINKARCLCAFIKANTLLLGQDSHRAKKEGDSPRNDHRSVDTASHASDNVSEVS